jgi:hypothetical protein
VTTTPSALAREAPLEQNGPGVSDQASSIGCSWAWVVTGSRGSSLATGRNAAQRQGIVQPGPGSGGTGKI